MTEFWVSQKNHWCEFCKVWLKDTISSRATHENGMKHKENVAKKLREMRHKGDAEKKEKELLERTWKGIEEKAKRQYEEDLRSGAVAKAVPKASAATTATQPAVQSIALAGGAKIAGSAGNSAWVLDKGSGYLYNEALRWYYDKATQFYYGGSPPEWTRSPPIPDAAKYKEAAAAGAAAAGAAESVSLASVTTKKYAHPMQDVGGVQFHQVGGKVGAARGLGVQGKESAKRKQPEASGGGGAAGKPAKKVSKEEAEALARREAARARTEKRTMKQFGLI
eukprot:CAMPEP_0177753912 /NCGR_PEP_ID=MMETSP0491_2-20121128/1725_1 /TAXON_ID=63592 /ORGANISM="Tetraselmis chuii, Strain PLY429" /LENGTH=278 /DNA_ID=CAMNT_0019269253 /DNA_START=205 /DNA_END=1045 /DNA_ORIENTATION=+